MQTLREAMAGQMGGAIHLSLIFCFFFIKKREEKRITHNS